MILTRGEPRGHFRITLKYEYGEAKTNHGPAEAGKPVDNERPDGRYTTMTQKETMRCKNCGEDWAGGVCIHCGCDEFVDVSRFYNKESLQAYRQQRQAVEL